MSATQFEVDASLSSGQAVTGIDEVGRGCLAGPAVVAAVTWVPDQVARSDWFAQLNDSKKIDAATRAALFPRIIESASRIKVACLSHMLIDSMDILRACLHGFELVAPEYDEAVPLFIDGRDKPTRLSWGRTLIKGDSRASAVAAAAVIAKVVRDGMLQELARVEPQYGLDQHKGYGTPVHLRALEAFGPGRYHRKCYKPITLLCPEEGPDDLAWCERITQSPEAGLGQLWGLFLCDYAKLSLSGARKALQQFHQRGIRLFPTPQDPLTQNSWG